MRIGFDLRPFLKEETGVGVYFRNFLFELAKLDTQDEFFLFSSSWKDRFSPDRIPPFVRRRFVDRRIPVRVLNAFWHRFEWPPLDAFFRTKLDLTHSPIPLFLPTRGKKIVTVNDLFFLERPDLADREARRDFVKKAGRAIQAADGVVTISRFSQGLIRDRFRVDEARVKVIPLGVSDDWLREPSTGEIDRVRKELDLPETFLLFVGAVEPRKNLVRLIEAVKILADGGRGVPLVVAGRPGGDSVRTDEAVRRLGLESLVRLTGYLDEASIRCLHRLAAVFVFPSLMEGFGLPVLEAMASGLAVAASGTSAIPEVGGDACLFFDPGQPEDIAGKVRTLLDDPDLRRSLVDKGKRRAAMFRWSETAAQTLEFYHAV